MKVTIRADNIEVEGYVNAVGRDSRKLTDDYGYPFVEQIAPGTFGRAITQAQNEDREIKMLLDHDSNHEIGGTNSNLSLEEDSIGLYARATVTDPETIKAAAEKRLKGWSFGFRGLDYKEQYNEGCTRRIITELELIEVSAIDDRMTPAYAGTSIHARADEGEETIYIRAISDDQVEYETESCAGATDEPEPAQDKSGAEKADTSTDKSGQQARGITGTEIAGEPVLHDYSAYRNKISLLKLM